MFKNRTETLVATVMPSNATNKALIWSSDSPSVAVVNNEGIVTSLMEGSAIITATTEDRGYSAQCRVRVVPVPQPEAVDLGLSVAWASFNVGASNPEELGEKFAWGETEAKTTFGWTNYKWANGSNKTLTKYNWDINYGHVDNRWALELEDDAAFVNLGTSWRMPSKEECIELCSNCKIEYYVMNGIPGVLFTSKQDGYTSNSIFLPSTTGELGCRYWTSTLLDSGHHETPDFAELLNISGGQNGDGSWSIDYSLGTYGSTDYNTGRSSGHCIRAVSDN